MKRLFLTSLVTVLFHFTYAQSPITDFKYEIRYGGCESMQVDFDIIYENNADADSVMWSFGDGSTQKSTRPWSWHTYENPGLYSVTLTLWKDSIKTQVSKPDLIKVKEAPVAFFTHSLDSALHYIAPVSVDFFNMSTKGEGDTLSYEWDVRYSYGWVDSTSTNTNYSLNMTYPGEYYVSLTASDENGCSSTYSDNFYIIDSIQIDEFEFITSPCHSETNDTSCDYGKYYEFYNDTLRLHGSYFMNCCTHETAVLKDQGDTIKVITFKTGMYCDCDCSFCFEIVIPNLTKDSCIIDFGGEQFRVYKNNSSKTKPEPIRGFYSYDFAYNCDSVSCHFGFQMLNLFCSDSGYWDFGDGSAYEYFTMNTLLPYNTVSHSYKNTGKYNVSLVNWVNGKRSVINQEKFLYPHNAPEAQFSYIADDTSLIAPVTIDFTNETQRHDKLSISYEWNLWNEDKSWALNKQDTNIAVTFNSAGKYTISLKSIDKEGCYSQWEDTIVIKSSGTRSLSILNNEALKIVPNPFEEFLVIQHSFKSLNKSIVTINNLSGQTLHSEALTSNNQKVDLSELSPGVYILKIANDKYHAVEKIVKK